MSKINIILAFISGAFISAILSYVIYNKQMIEPWEDYKRIERSIEEVSNFKKYSMPNIKLLHRGSWLKGEVEKIDNIKVVIDKDKVIDSLVKEKSNGDYSSKKFLRSYYSAYIDAIIAMNNQELETGYIIYKKSNINSDKWIFTGPALIKDTKWEIPEIDLSPKSRFFLDSINYIRITSIATFGSLEAKEIDREDLAYYTLASSPISIIYKSNYIPRVFGQFNGANLIGLVIPVLIVIAILYLL